MGNLILLPHFSASKSPGNPIWKKSWQLLGYFLPNIARTWNTGLLMCNSRMRRLMVYRLWANSLIDDSLSSRMMMGFFFTLWTLLPSWYSSKSANCSTRHFLRMVGRLPGLNSPAVWESPRNVWTMSATAVQSLGKWTIALKYLLRNSLHGLCKEAKAKRRWDVDRTFKSWRQYKASCGKEVAMQ